MQLTITKHPDNASPAETTRMIGEEGGSIGRGGSNAWTLDDPERFLSSRHAEIVCEGGNYFVVDLSTNGTFLNDSQEPIGKGNRVQLNEGDRLVMGDYELTVSLWAPSFDAAAGTGPFGEPPPVAEAPSAPDPLPDIADPFASPQNPGAGGFNPDPLPPSFMPQQDGDLFPNEEVLDPLELLNGGGASGSRGTDDLFGGAPAGGADPFGGPPAGASDPLGGSANGMPDLFGAPSNDPAFPPVGGAPQDPAAGGSQGYNVDPLSQNFVMPEFHPENPDTQSQPPAAGGMGGGAELIPEDWDPFAPDDGAGVQQAEPQGQGGFQIPNPVPTPPPQQAQPVPPAQPPREAQPMPPPVQPPPQQVAPVQPPPEQMQPTPPVQPPPQQVQPPPPVQPPPQQVQPTPPVQAPQPAAGAGVGFSSGDAALLQALGITHPGFSEVELKALNTVIGEFVREAVSGLIKVLGSRNSIKNEFRMSVTTIQPVENNPLKFAATVEDAIENMFVKRGKAYKPPVEAVRESFDSIADHQVAILAGMRSAFNSILERFDPDEMQKRFEKQGTGAMIPGMRKSRYWEMYEEYFRELTKDLDDSFQFLFGDEFVQAYEGQLTKLAGARRRTPPR